MRRFFLSGAWLVAVVALAWAPPGARAGEPVDLATYRQAIDDALDLVEEERVEEAADLLAAIGAVTLPGGETVPVDHAGLVTGLRGRGAERTAAVARLRALAGELETWPSGAPAPDAFEKLEEILARLEFPPVPPLDLRLPDWVSDLLAPLAALGRPLLIVGMALLAAIVAYFLTGLWGSFVAQSEAKEEKDGTTPLTANQARAQSWQMASAGDYRTAVRLLYLSTLLLLEERRLLRYDRTLTNREYLRQVRDRARLAQALRPVVDTFDEVWYGQIEPDAALYQEYARQVDEVHEVDG
jgi:hypothetical protein